LTQTELESILERVQVPEYAREWLDGKLAQKLSDASIRRYLYDLKCWNLDISSASFSEIQARLAECGKKYSRSTVRRLGICVKQILKTQGRLAESEKIKLSKASDPRVVVYSKDDIEKLLKGCRTLRNRLLIEILVEAGPRRGELYNMRIKDVQFDQYSPIIWLHGKTGTRSRRVYAASEDLRKYLEFHPNRENPEARFWLTEDGRPLSSNGLYKVIKKLGWRILHRPIFPHGFRHTAATKDVSLYTDRESMIRFGWKTPSMVGIYAHLSARDVDEKDLRLHGLKKASEATEPLLQLRHCPKCEADNAPASLFCQKCGAILQDTGNEELRKTIMEDRTKIELLFQIIEGLQKQQEAE